MTTRRITTEDDGGTVPVACALTPGDPAARFARWERLSARAMTRRAETADGLRLSFRPVPGVEEELRVLAAMENECCPWAGWTVETNAREVMLDVRSAGEGIATLHGMFA